MIYLPLCQAADAEYLITAARTGPADQTALDAETLQRWQDQSVLPALNRVPGVRAFEKGGRSYLSVRGGEPNYTLVMIEGVRVNDPTNAQGGAFDFSQLPPEILDRAVVAPGGLSAAQGADALAGVVQLRLLRPAPAESRLRISALGDSSGGASGSATLLLGARDSGLVFSGGARDSGELTPGASLSRQYGLLKYERVLGAVKSAAFVLGSHTNARAFPEDSGGPRLAVNRAQETRDTGMTLTAIDFSRAEDAPFAPHLAFRWSSQAGETATPAIAPGVLDGVPAIAADTRFERLSVLADAVFTPVRPLRFALGAEYAEERGESVGSIDFGGPLPVRYALNRETSSAFAEVTLSPRPGMALTLGSRADVDRDGVVEGSWRGRLELTPLSTGPQWFVSAATAYKQPSLFALGYPLIANPALKPERGRSLETGLVFETEGGLHWQASVFEQRFRDMIDFDPARFTNVNRAHVVTRGVQTSWAQTLATDWAASANLTWLDLESATPLRARPHWQGNAELRWHAQPRLMATLAGAFNDDSLDSAIPTGLVRAPGHFTVDLGARWQARSDTRLTLALRNLLDTRYAEAVGFPAAGRTLFLSVQLDI
jgi:outer membrane receptor protein involved in Fe transport